MQLTRRAARWLERRALLRRGAFDPGAERAWLARAVRLRPDHAPALRALARWHQLRGEREAARALWLRAAEAAPRHPEAPAQLAWLSLWLGETDGARAWAELALAAAPAPGRPFAEWRQMRSLLDHLALADPTLRHRHVALCGVSFCGSTLLSHMLGTAPGVANVGESHWLVHRPEPGGSVEIDFARDPYALQPQCGACGAACPVLTRALRETLSAERVNWSDRIADAFGTRILVSADKNQRKRITLDPLLRFDAVVLFKSPTEAWASEVRKGRRGRDVGAYLSLWDTEYRRLAFDLPSRGRRLFVHFDRFREDPERHLRRLCEALALPFDPAMVRGVRPDQHALGGNPRVHGALRSGAGIEVAARDEAELPAAERATAAHYERASDLYAWLRAEHARLFAGA